MSGSHAPNHNYHLVDPSVWPIFCAVSTFIMFFGGVLYMHFDNVWVVSLGGILTLFGSYSWWGDVIKEGEHHGITAQSFNLALGMACFCLLFQKSCSS